MRVGELPAAYLRVYAPLSRVAALRSVAVSIASMLTHPAREGHDQPLDGATMLTQVVVWGGGGGVSTCRLAKAASGLEAAETELVSASQPHIKCGLFYNAMALITSDSG